MEQPARYRVLREHIGDRAYFEGEEREALPSQVGHLLGRVLEPLEAAKAEPTPRNKAEGAAPANKASGRRKSPSTKTKG